MPYHYVVGFDILMDHVNYPVAIVECAQHVDEVVTRLPRLHAHSDHVFGAPFFATLSVPFFVLLVELPYMIVDAAVGVVLCHEVNVTVLLGIVNDFLEPDDVWMLQLLQNLELLKDRIVGRPTGSKHLALQISLGHLLEREQLAVWALAQQHLGEAALAQRAYHVVIVNVDDFLFLVEHLFEAQTGH